MRTTTLKIDGQRVQAVLVAGGPGFKIYTATGVDGFVVSSKKRIIVVVKENPNFKTVGRYVNLRFQPLPEQPVVKTEFDAFLQASHEAVPQPSELPTDLQT